MEKKKNSGFTIIEMLVTIGVLTLLSGILITYSKSGENASVLLRQGAKIVTDVNRAKNLAVTTATFTDTEGNIIHPCGYGVYFDDVSEPNRYVIYADLSTTNCKSSEHIRPADGSADVETIELNSSISIDKKNIESVFYLPPDPVTYFNPSEISEASITIKATSGAKIEIRMSKAGQVSTF
jgi:prepilin-type N-terminal cleavage/methylation domain-containing protein